MKIKIKKEKLDNFNLPLVDNRFLYDYEDDYFEDFFPFMWRNVALKVENNYWKKIDEEYQKLEKEVMMKVFLQDCPDKWLFDSLTNYIQHVIKYKKSCMARDMMIDKLRQYNIASKEKFYIVTKEELEIHEKIKVQKANETFIIKIKDRWLDVVINKRKWRTNFKYKDSIDYIISFYSFWTYKRTLIPRELEIINACVEAWLFYKYIWEIFGWNEKSTARILKQIWITSVFLTPQKDFRKSQKVKVLDITWYFVIEKENDLFYKS